MPATPRVTTRNARFQQWSALLTNRTKRYRVGQFLVHGVRPISLAVAYDWPIEALLVRDGALSAWARALRADLDLRGRVPQYVVSAELLAELADRDSAAEAPAAPELVAVARTRPDELDRIRLGPAALVVVLDRPSSPGNVGTAIRSADAFGAAGVVLCGHGADVYDPRTVRASTGSLFAVPTVTVDAPRAVLDWLAGQPQHVQLVGTDETAADDVDRTDLRSATALVVGNETSGMSSAWRQACERSVAIPIGGAASSLNAAAATTTLLYEAARQRGFPHRGAAADG